MRAYDPQGRVNAESLLPGVEWADGALDAAEDADLLVILTEWNEFRALNLKALKERMRGRVIVDLRNVMRPDDARAEGFIYAGIGRANTVTSAGTADLGGTDAAVPATAAVSEPTGA